MNDLVKRLRRMADMTTFDNDLLDIGRAADRIEELERENEALLIKRFTPDADRIEDLQARLDSEIANGEWQRGERDQRITELERENARFWQSNQDLFAENEKVQAENARLLAAAIAVVERWDTPLWEDPGPTAYVINRLRAAIDPSVDIAIDAARNGKQTFR